MSRSNSLNTVAPARRNEIRNQNLNSPVSIDDAFDRALQAGLHVSDGSVYEPTAAIDLIEEVTARELPFVVPSGTTTHYRVTYTDDSTRQVSCVPHLYEESDDFRTFLLVELRHLHVDGQKADLDPKLIEKLEEWVLSAEKGAA
jgi:hypothetical protein